MADFQSLTHRARWIFTPGELYGVTLMEVDIDGTLSYPKPQVNADSRPKPISIEEEQFMRVFYENKLLEVCTNFHFPHKVQATVLIYFKRFYLQWSVMQHHPKNIMLTCIYAACKIEENRVSAEELEIAGAARTEVDKIMLTDAPLLFPPGQLALAALRSANQVCRVADFERCLSSILSRQSSAHTITISELVEFLNAIDSWV